MKHSFLSILVLVMLFGCSKPSIDHDTLNRRDGLYYEVNSSKPYTGRSIEWYRYFDGTPKFSSPHFSRGFKRGLMHGRQTSYSEEPTYGTIDCIEHYRLGVKHGSEVLYYKSGQVHQEINFVDGEMHGEFKRYHENGQLRFIGSIIAGKKQGRWIEYYPNGNVKHRPYYDDDEDADY